LIGSQFSDKKWSVIPDKIWLGTPDANIIEESTCYMESNCTFFDVEYYINLGIEEYSISKYTDELILYLNYFNMRDVLLRRLSVELK